MMNIQSQTDSQAHATRGQAATGPHKADRQPGPIGAHTFRFATAQLATIVRVMQKSSDEQGKQYLQTAAFRFNGRQRRLHGQAG